MVVQGVEVNLENLFTTGHFVERLTHGESRVKEYYRWLTNEGIGAELYFLPSAPARSQSLSLWALLSQVQPSALGMQLADHN